MIDVETREQRAEFYSSSEWRVLREQVLLDSKYECVWCKENGKVTTQVHSILEVDHVKELEHYPGLALNADNLRVLCKDCHNRRHKRFNYKPKLKEIKWNDERWD